MGVEVATEIYQQGLTLEEYLDVVSIDNETSPAETFPAEDVPGQFQEEEIPYPEEITPDDAYYPEETTVQETVPAVQETLPEDAEIVDAPLEAP